MMPPQNGALPDNTAIPLPGGSFGDLAGAIFDVLGSEPPRQTMMEDQVRATALLHWARRRHEPSQPRDEWIAVVELIIALAALSGCCPPPAEGCS